MYDCVHQQKVIFRLRLFLILREYLTPRLRCFVSNCKNIKSRLSRFCHSCMIKQPSGKWKQNFNSAMGESSQSAANITSTILLVSEWIQSSYSVYWLFWRLGASLTCTGMFGVCWWDTGSASPPRPCRASYSEESRASESQFPPLPPACFWHLQWLYRLHTPVIKANDNQLVTAN